MKISKHYSFRLLKVSINVICQIASSDNFIEVRLNMAEQLRSLFCNCYFRNIYINIIKCGFFNLVTDIGVYVIFLSLLISWSSLNIMFYNVSVCRFPAITACLAFINWVSGALINSRLVLALGTGNYTPSPLFQFRREITRRRQQLTSLQFRGKSERMLVDNSLSYTHASLPGLRLCRESRIIPIVITSSLRW